MQVVDCGQPVLQSAAMEIAIAHLIATGRLLIFHWQHIFINSLCGFNSVLQCLKVLGLFGFLVCLLMIVEMHPATSLPNL